jgi:hypothetical protein
MGIALAGAGLVAVVVLAAVRVAACRARRSPLRRCPLCAADAIVWLHQETVDERFEAVELRCGECGTWRRVVTTPDAARGLQLALARQRRAMRELADQLGREVASRSPSAR